MKRPLSLPIAVLAILAASNVQAQPRLEQTREQASAMVERTFERLDANDDGVLNDADREARQRARFDRLDADSDGAVSFAEMQNARERSRERKASAPGDQRVRGEHRRGRGGMGGMRHMARAADTNEDGAISRDEFRTAALARFDDADANGDGTVTLDERRAMRQQMRDHRQAERQNGVTG